MSRACREHRLSLLLPLFFLIAAIWPQPSSAQAPAPAPAALEVCVVLKAGGSPLPGATIVLLRDDGSASALTAGSNGCARGESLAPGHYRLTVTSPSTVPADLDLDVAPGVSLTRTVALEVAHEAAAQEIVVAADREGAGETRHSIDPEIVKTIPGAEGDALKAVQNLPGLARTPFGLGGLIVRGAAPGDTKVFLDGQEIPQLYHFGGLTSVVSTEMLTSIDFLPGGFGVRYGGAQSGVVDVETKAGRDDQWGGVVDANVYHAEAEAQGPVGADARNGRVIAAVRRSYIDAVLPAVLPGDVLAMTVAPRYYDYQLRYDAPPAANGARAQILVYGSDDAFSFLLKKAPDEAADARGRFLYRTRFHRVQAPIVLPFSNGWIATVTPAAGYQDAVADANGLAALDATRTDGSVRAELRGTAVPGVVALFGAQAQAFANHFVATFRDDAAVTGTTVNPGTAAHTTTASGQYPTATVAAYAQAEADLGRGVTLVPGVRVDGYLPTGHASIDPRVAVRWTPDERWSWKAYAGVYHQAPQFQEWDKSVGNPRLRPPYAIQTGLGGRRSLGNGASIESEVFWKWLGDQVAQRPADAPDPTSRVEYTNEQIGRAYGLEILAKQELDDRFYGWVAYTLSRSERADPYVPGGWRAFDFDQTHIFTALGGWRFRRDWEASARFRYATGNPMTPVTRSIYDSDNDTWVPVPGVPNGARMPAFTQLDLRVDKKWQFPTFSVAAYVDVQNVFARQNPEAVRYSFDYDRRYYVTGLTTLPMIGLRGEF